MKILTVLTYYRPYTSGLTIYAERLAKTLAKRGHQSTVIAMQHDKRLPLEETLEGVRVVRVPALLKISKGQLAPAFGRTVSKLMREHDLMHLHLPQFEAAWAALHARRLKRPSLITFHCDLLMPPGIGNRIINSAVHLMNNAAGLMAKRVVAYTEDYAQHTPYLRRFSKKLSVILPPVELPEASQEQQKNYAEKAFLNDAKGPRIGMAARLATEKGVEVLLDALPEIKKKFPDATVFFAGQYQNVLGEEAYLQKLKPRLEKLEQEGRWKFLGILSPGEMTCFFKNLDLLVVPSLNCTESFGLVQIEAMMHGVPVAVSDLPGVRQPVMMSGMGRIFPIGSARGLAQAAGEILSHPERFKTPPAGFFEKFTHDFVAAEYEKVYREILE